MRRSATGQPPWTAAEIGDQHGRTVLITGGNSGIGFETAKTLAARGATVLFTYRDRTTATAAVQAITSAVPGTTIHTQHLDLASLASIRRVADWVRSNCPRLDLLINNGGIMMAPKQSTEDGFELHIGTNHLGHFALTGLLLDRLVQAEGSRVVTVSSSAHLQGRMDLDDLHFTDRRYRPSSAYAQSKLANILFTKELQHRLTSAGVPTIAVALEPGYVRTHLPRSAASPMRLAVGVVTRLLGQPDTATGALATLRAATDPRTVGGDYYGPAGWLRAAGAPIWREPGPAARDHDLGRRLWAESERLTGISYQLTDPATPSGTSR
jgi:NAD(P)-dependent dehydrogenase (short-subunit alcohol dehydrogenase family)